MNGEGVTLPSANGDSCSLSFIPTDNKWHTWSKTKIMVGIALATLATAALIAKPYLIAGSTLAGFVATVTPPGWILIGVAGLSLVGCGAISLLLKTKRHQTQALLPSERPVKGSSLGAKLGDRLPKFKKVVWDSTKGEESVFNHQQKCRAWAHDDACVIAHRDCIRERDRGKTDEAAVEEGVRVFHKKFGELYTQNLTTL